MKKLCLGSLIIGLICGFSSDAIGEGLSLSETSYTGASILQGDWEVTFDNVEDVNPDADNLKYAFFEGNTLYVGNSDSYGNSVDGIVEFFWFQSSIDRGSDFYVAVIKARATPGHDCYWGPWISGADCHLWADEYQDWGEYPVLSIEALTDVNREAGAFRWDWSVPFENYGIDAYGQVTFSNQYGIGANAEGALMAHGEIPLDEDGNVEAAGNVQVKGYISPEYSVQTQYEVTLYEWDVFVDGRANMMAWDMYLNLGARDSQSAYHEYFLAIQVEEGQPFALDELNFVSYFDTGWWNPISHELGLSLQDIEIMQPVYEQNNTEPSEELEENDTGISEEELEALEDSGEIEDETLEEPSNEDMPELSSNTTEPIKSCQTIALKPSRWAYVWGIFLGLFIYSRRTKW
jgi:hypothetical protein